MVHHGNCPLCSSENNHIYLRTMDHFLSLETFSLVKCSNCGFIFTQDHPDQEYIGRYYESEAYLSHSDSAKGFSNRLYRLSRSVMLRKKRELVRKSAGLKKGNLLDIGSGTGHFPAEMKKAGWSVRGIEINPGARENSISRFGLDILPPEKIREFPSAEFDCITMWHVLEHLQDPFFYASEISRLLKPGGICIVALPVCDSFDARHYQEFWAAYDVPRHLWHFTPRTFRYFAEKAGFEITATRRLPIDVFYISILSEKNKGSNLSFVTGMVKGTGFAIMSLFKKNRSSSVIYCIKKKSN
jgi:SAM-dependent methyltransferase